MFLTRENDISAFQNIVNNPERPPERQLTDSVSGSPTSLCKKHQTPQCKDCGLRTADCGLRTADCEQWTVDNGFRSTPP